MFAKSAQNQPICWALWGLNGMHPDMQVMPQACQSTATYPQGKWNIPAAIISSMDRGTHHNTSLLSCALLLNVPKPSPSVGCCVAQKGCILTCRSCLKSVDTLPRTQKANGPCQHQSSPPWTEAHIIMYHFSPDGFLPHLSKINPSNRCCGD